MITDRTRKFFAVILLFLLIVVPFIDWKLGAVMWMCAWLVFIFQNIFDRKSWHLEGKDNEDDEEEEEEGNHRS
jgi:hypothetical protein